MDDKTTDEEDAIGPCPECGGLTTLVPLGDRIDHPHRWLRWARTVVHLYVCVQCGAIREVTEIKTHVPLH